MLLAELTVDDELLKKLEHTSSRPSLLERSSMKTLYENQRAHVTALQRVIMMQEGNQTTTETNKADLSIQADAELAHSIRANSSLLADVEHLRESVQKILGQSVPAPWTAVFEYHENETTFLLCLLRMHEDALRNLCRGDSSALQEVQRQRQWKDMYLQQREQIAELQQLLATTSTEDGSLNEWRDRCNQQDKDISLYLVKIDALESQVTKLSLFKQAMPATTLPTEQPPRVDQREVCQELVAEQEVCKKILIHELETFKVAREELFSTMQQLRERVLLKNAMVAQGMEEVIQYHKEEVDCLLSQLRYNDKVWMNLIHGQPRRESEVETNLARAIQYTKLYEDQRQHVMDLQGKLGAETASWKRDLEKDFATATRLHAQAKDQMAEDMRRLRGMMEGFARVSGLQDVDSVNTIILDFHKIETEALMAQLRADDSLLTLLTEGNKNIEGEMEAQRHMKSLYEKQSEHVNVMERKLLQKSRHSGARDLLEDCTMAVIQEFMATSQKELEKEKMEWRTRCLAAEQQLKTVEESFQTTIRDDANATKRAGQQPRKR